MMKTMYQTNKTLIRPDWKTVGIISTALFLFFAGLVVGNQLKKLETEDLHAGFSSLEDMNFLVSELRKCKEEE